MTDDIFVETVESFMQDYFPKLIQGIQERENKELDELSNKIVETIRKEKHIFAFGNGGSEAIAENLVYSLEKRISDEFQFDTYSNPKLSDATDVANNELFNHRINRSGKPGDLAFLISASGNSKNINNISKVCKDREVETISISADGKIANNPETKSDYPIVIPIKDQQILEDVTLGITNLLTGITQYKLEGKKFEIEDIKRTYISKLQGGYNILTAGNLWKLAQSISTAYSNGNVIRVDALDNGGLSIIARHMEHNLKWDALQNINSELSNKVLSGLPTIHFTGVGNDGGEGFNYATEVRDNNGLGDVEIIFSRDLESKPTKNLLRSVVKKEMDIYTFCFNAGEEYVESNLAQVTLHQTSRILNTYLLLQQGTIKPEQFGEQLKSDLAMLRQRDKIKTSLETEYGTG